MDRNQGKNQSPETLDTGGASAEMRQGRGRRNLRWRKPIEVGLHWQFTLLMIVLLLFTALIPLGDVISFRSLDVVFSIVVLMAVLVAGRQHRWVLIGLILIFPPLLLASIKDLDDTTPLIIYNAYLGLLSLFILIAIVSILQDVLKGRQITIHSISGVIAVYILMALLWAIGYSLVALNWPGSFATQVSASWPDASISSTAVFATLFFYSIVTITTAGYGDVTAISPYARSLTSLELVLGQVFLAVLVAWLVGMYIAGSIEDKNETS